MVGGTRSTHDTGVTFGADGQRRRNFALKAGFRVEASDENISFLVHSHVALLREKVAVLANAVVGAGRTLVWLHMGNERVCLRRAVLALEIRRVLFALGACARVEDVNVRSSIPIPENRCFIDIIGIILPGLAEDHIWYVKLDQDRRIWFKDNVVATEDILSFFSFRIGRHTPDLRLRVFRQSRINWL